MVMRLMLMLGTAHEDEFKNLQSGLDSPVKSSSGA